MSIYAFEKNKTEVGVRVCDSRLKKKGVLSAVGFLHCAGSGEELFFKPQALST